MKKNIKTLITGSVSLAVCGLSNAALVSQFGVLDLDANGGTNPNTGVAWAAGDQYRLAFHTDAGTQAISNDPSFYDSFATSQAQMNPLLASSSGWTALVYVNTDSSQNQGVSPVSSPRDRAGLTDITGGDGIGGAGVPMYAMDGTTAIARNTADMYNGWSNPFDGDTTIRLASGTTNNNSDGNPVVASQNVNYSPFLDQFALGDSATVHGTTVWTGGFGSSVNPLGDTADEVRASNGSSNANNAGRTWNRFQANNTSSLSVYAISPVLTVTDVIPEPSTTLLGGLASLFLLRRRRK